MHEEKALMKYFASLVLATGLLLACNNSSNSNTAKDTASTAVPTNVQNVNGNTPDTTSGMTLNKPLPVDSSRIKDSAKH